MAERNEDGGCVLEVVETVMLLLKIFAASFVGSVLFVYACLAFILQETDPTMWPVGGRLELVLLAVICGGFSGIFVHQQVLDKWLGHRR